MAGSLPQDRICEASSDTSETGSNNEDDDVIGTQEITVRVDIKQASGLPLSLSNFVFCQYTFWNHPEPIVVPPNEPESHTNIHQPGKRDSMTFKFNCERKFTIHVTEEFLEHCSG